MGLVRVTLISILGFMLALGGCANPGIVKLSPDTYMLARTDRAGIFGNTAAMKADVIREANEFAAKQGKVAIPLSSNEIPVAVGRFASFEYQFRVVDKDDPEVRRVNLVPRADVVIEKSEQTSVDVNIGEEDRSGDLYTDLIKLEDLRSRGILTDDEFAEQKRKLLNGN